LKRKTARFLVLQALYASEHHDHSESRLLHEVMALNDLPGSPSAFAVQLMQAVRANTVQLDRWIEPRLINWNFDRLARNDLLLLRMGIAELLYFPAIPPEVSLNETISLAKQFGTENAPRFINGILDDILRSLTASGDLNKDASAQPLPRSKKNGNGKIKLTGKK
jgi:transcription antitermination factor NusB